ncbi:MAG TPA: glycosyltransferase [Acidobacteriota bacterium]|nr:glycosyltransferase [Acidobacteriota bacterium]
MSEKRVLFIANDFPPIGGAGIQRPLFFAKYLPEFGWFPVVLTVREVAYPVKDPTLLTRVPEEVRIVRTETLELRRLLWLIRRARRPKNGAAGKAAPGSDQAVSSKAREWGRALRRWLFVPDDRMLWAPFAVWAALREIRHAEISAIYATAPSYSSGVIGLIVSRLSSLPLVLDLRDPWTLDPYLPSATWLHAAVDRKLESATMKQAARIVVISETMRQRLLAVHPGLEDKVRVITNGYDAQELDRLKAQEPGGKFLMVYSGSLYSHHKPALRAFCKAWSRLARDNEDFRQRAVLRLVGRCDPEIREEISHWQTSADLCAEVLGYLPHSESLSYLKGASALLLLIKELDPARHVITIPGKLFEYVAVDSPILMIGPDGDAAEIVRKTGGLVLRQGDCRGTVCALERIFRWHMEGSGPLTPTERREQRRRFERRTLTADLARQLDNAARNEQTA